MDCELRYQFRGLNFNSIVILTPRNEAEGPAFLRTTTPPNPLNAEC